MTTQPAAGPNKTNYSPKLFILICILLIGNFLWRMIVTADEYPPRSVQILGMVIDAGMIAGLIGIRKSGPQLLFIIALIAGIGLFAIRLHSDASWWTGHWHYIFDRR
jgi:uncharacterized membrane protein